MKYLCISTLVVLVSISSANAAEKEKHLFILSGQSNMEILDPSESFTPAVSKAFGEANVIVVKFAQWGLPIRSWYKKWKPAQGDVRVFRKAPGQKYDRLMIKVKAAVKGEKFTSFTSVTFVWMQGERDAGEKHGEVYAASLKGLIGQLAADLGRKDVNFVIGRLSDFDMGNKKRPHWTMVRNAQVEVAEAYSRGAWVDTDDCNAGAGTKSAPSNKDLHYTAEGYRILGERFAKAAIELIKK